MIGYISAQNRLEYRSVIATRDPFPQFQEEMVIGDDRVNLLYPVKKIDSNRVHQIVSTE